MGYRLGTPDAVGFFSMNCNIFDMRICFHMDLSLLVHRYYRQRPYHVECTASRPISKVKQRRVWSVLGWVTAWEHQMLLAFFFNAIFLLRVFVLTWIFSLSYGCVIQIE